MAFSEVRVALIGAGGIGRVHALRYAKVRHAVLAAIVDIDVERARALCAEVRGAPRAFASVDELLDARAVDAVDVCLPTWLHEEVVVRAARAGLHVLCEKPMSLTLASARRMEAAVREAGIVYMTAFCRRYDNHWLTARAALQRGAIGTPVVWRTAMAGRGGSQPWYVQKDKGGGPLIDGLIHNYDFARYTFGEAVWAMAATRILRSDATAFDTGTAVVRFSAGADLSVCWSWGMAPGVRAPRLNDVLGPNGVLYFDPTPEQLSRALAGAPGLNEGEGAILIDRGNAGGLECLRFEKNDMYQAEIQAFVDTVREGRPSPVGTEESIRSLAVAEAVLQAEERQEPVRIEALLGA